jgi:hypothetical protein
MTRLKQSNDVIKEEREIYIRCQIYSDQISHNRKMAAKKNK